jgi:hypothetical protein
VDGKHPAGLGERLVAQPFINRLINYWCNIGGYKNSHSQKNSWLYIDFQTKYVSLHQNIFLVAKDNTFAIRQLDFARTIIVCREQYREDLVQLL